MTRRSDAAAALRTARSARSVNRTIELWERNAADNVIQDAPNRRQVSMRELALGHALICMQDAASKQLKINLDYRFRCHWLTVQSGGPKAPMRYGFDGLFIQPQAQALADSDVANVAGGVNLDG